jgi:PAS domain S-box-containing protein
MFAMLRWPATSAANEALAMKTISGQLGTARNHSPARRAWDWSVLFNSPTVATALLVFVGYYLGARIGFALTLQPHPVSVLWPPNSILVAGLLLSPPRIWWLVLLAAFPAHWAAQLQSHVPPLMILCWFVSNSCEALIGAGLTRYLVGGPIRFTTLRNVGIFCLCVVFIGPFLSSFLDAALVVWNNWGQDTYWKLIRIRLFSNALAALIVVPLVVTWATTGIQSLRTAGRSRYLEACALFVGLLVGSYAVLYKFGPGADSALLFLPLPFLLWAAVRFGSLGASTAISVVSFLAIWSAAHGHGPFSGATVEQDALSIQIFLIALAIPLLFLATVVEERASGETELRESESRFRMVADAAPVLIWMSGADKRCTFFNKPWLEFTGRSVEQELGNGWGQGVHPDDLQKCLKTYTEAFDARQPFVMQYRLRRNDGEYRWVSDNGVPRYDTQKNFAGYVGSCTDVTELINKDAALHEFEERVGLAAKAARLGVWELDAATNEMWMSDSARALFQFDSETRVNHALLQDRVHPEDRALRDSAVKAAIETHGEYTIEYRVLLPDGTLRWIGARGRYVTKEDGAGARLIGVSIDITERKQAEQKFRLAVEASPSGIVLVDREGRIVLVNAHVEELFGYRREELVGKLVDILVPERFRGIHPAHRAKFLAKPEAVVIGAGRELFARRKDGTEFPVEIGLNPIETADGIVVLAAVADITARKEAELESLRHREELSHLSRVAAMGELAASIAHELNQPLSGITSNAGAGQRFIDRGNVDLRELRDLLGDIMADARRAGEVIRGIQSMVKKGAPARQRLNLNDLVINVARMVNPNAMLQSCELETLLEPDLPTVEADPIQLQQVILNLVINAFDAMRDMAVPQRKVVIGTERTADGAIRTSVRDYGVGISDQTRDRLFDHFFTTKAQGLGMGLAIVRSIVESHGGTIQGENVEGGGARFHFTLPATAAPSVV